jgi:hypothetical protein
MCGASPCSARACFAVWRDERGVRATRLPSDLSGPHVPYEVPVRDIVTGRVLRDAGLQDGAGHRRRDHCTTRGSSIGTEGAQDPAVQSGSSVAAVRSAPTTGLLQLRHDCDLANMPDSEGKVIPYRFKSRSARRRAGLRVQRWLCDWKR